MITPTLAIEYLKAGNQRYIKGITSNRLPLVKIAQSFQEQQTPFAAIVSCSDSRVVPEFIFDQVPGQLFVLRVAGNLVDEVGLASIEFAVEVLHIPLIVVMGHSDCGALQATIEAVCKYTQFPGTLPQLTKKLARSVNDSQFQLNSETQDLLEKATWNNIIQQVVFLEQCKPIIAPFIQKRALKIVGALYSLETGEVSFTHEA